MPSGHGCLLHHKYQCGHLWVLLLSGILSMQQRVKGLPCRCCPSLGRSDWRDPREWEPNPHPPCWPLDTGCLPFPRAFPLFFVLLSTSSAPLKINIGACSYLCGRRWETAMLISHYLRRLRVQFYTSEV